MAKNKTLENVEDWLLITGGINWGLGLFSVNVVELADNLVGGTGVLKMITYGAIALSAIHKAWMKFN